MSENGYSPVPGPRRLLDAKAVSELFDKKPAWFSSDRVRKRLYSQGFPLPVERGRWLRTAVEAYQERMGNRRLPPPAPSVRYLSRKP